MKQSWIYIKKLALFAPNKIFFGKINYINLICLLVPFIQKNWKKNFCADPDLRGEVIFKSKMGPNSHFPQFDVSLSLLHCMKSKKKKKKKKVRPDPDLPSLPWGSIIYRPNWSICPKWEFSKKQYNFHLPLSPFNCAEFLGTYR